MRHLLRETCRPRIASDTLVQLRQKVSRSLQPSQDDPRRQIPASTSVPIDESSHRENGQGRWTSVFRVPRFTLFQIDPNRVPATDEAASRGELIAQREQLARVAAERVPETELAGNLAHRFPRYANQSPRFTQVSGLEPTNNAAEQALRQFVIDRNITQGTRGIRGREGCEHIWTTIATCRQHGRGLRSFREQPLLAQLADTPPSLLRPAP
ncbi:MAG: transposase [Pirellulaceae bacterium]|nr:transposase [Pirellulaceae bacterium]